MGYHFTVTVALSGIYCMVSVIAFIVIGQLFLFRRSRYLPEYFHEYELVEGRDFVYPNAVYRYLRLVESSSLIGVAKEKWAEFETKKLSPRVIYSYDKGEPYIGIRRLHIHGL